MLIDWVAIAPEIALTVTALVVLLADLNLRGDAKQLIAPLAGLGTIVALVFTLVLWGDDDRRSLRLHRHGRTTPRLGTRGSGGPV
jgi:NADH:ubiquinone oxidoreductase subunit 2 (subunit N)